MSIFDEVRKTFANEKIGTQFSRKEIVEIVHEKTNINRLSIIPSDYCYNRSNNGINFTNYLHLFRYDEKNSYTFLGENYQYSGEIMHKPKYESERVIGVWVNGVLTMF